MKKILHQYLLSPERAEVLYDLKVKNPVTVTITSND